MASVVFLRGVNVGGHKRFQPAALAAELADLSAVNIGAAGTFVVRSKVSDKVLRDRILNLLPFKPEIMICPAAEIVALMSGDPFHGIPLDKSLRAVVTIMSAPAVRPPKLPLYAPDPGKWEVKVVLIEGRAALSLWRPGDGKILYPNEVIEKAFHVASTTRSWSTIEKVARLLGEV